MGGLSSILPTSTRRKWSICSSICSSTLNADVEARDTKGVTPLMATPRVGCTQFVIDDDASTALVHHGADINSQGGNGDSPLHFTLC